MRGTIHQRGAVSTKSSEWQNPHVPSEPTWDVALLFPEQGTWSEEEYLALEGNRLIEFSHGYVEILPMPVDSHQAIVGFIYQALLAISAGAHPGVARFAPLRLRLWPGKFREPDLLFLRAERDALRGQQYWEGADLVVEVVSSDDRRRDLVVKRREYAKAAIPEYWIVDPDAGRIIVLSLRGDSYEVHGEFSRGQDATSCLLDGFAVSVSDAFDAA